ncbi:hypothetical protein FDI40_gp162 [Agrobacterium phage Atu_ph07]|uniref:Uncharacterized protein n=1 Tax=Agrobacterium phage Atu_ph07 TaxID=2024264 RepID=A0A2L0UZH5_9CAUD|nr:hypothetical protein FDI40_gp162 [Agrobacterium phage Atu_ph07]AUZ94944.1 hypothetical protein [Agrobacterium phage Atu_ph07]
MDALKALKVFGAMAECGIPVTVVGEHKFEIGGFYKSGTVMVDLERSEITDRYKDVTAFDDDSFVFDLVSLHNNWHTRSKDRLSDWKNVHGGWEIFIERLDGLDFEGRF